MKAHAATAADPDASMGAQESIRRAWRESPGDYQQRRPVTHRLPDGPRSRYLRLEDGCRLAIDVYLPEPLPGEHAGPFPTVLVFTPYYRRFRLKPGSHSDPNPHSGKLRDLFVPRGFAMVVVDIRGTGASFGTRSGFRSPRERLDSREVADWVAAQPWCDGRLGATGISYLGAAADFLASTGHPAVKAIAPLFSVWDTYSDNYFPGGLQATALTASYDLGMVALDQDRRDLLRQFPAFANPDFEGPAPVEDDPRGELLAEALREHGNNYRQIDYIPEFRFREEGLSYRPSESSASFSPYSYSDGVRPDVAVLSVSGWMDGAGYMNGAISRFLTLHRNPRHLLLGPWDHGARVDCSPWRDKEVPDFPIMGEVLRFFDHYLAGRPTGLELEAPIHYFTVHAQAWRSAQAWPPPTRELVLHCEAGSQHDGRLSLQAPAMEASAPYQVDFTTATGSATRYERIAGLDPRQYYPDWRTDLHLCFTSEPLAEALEFAGHAIVNLALRSSQPDAALFVYLTEIDEEGHEHHVTEGMLRALHRKESPAPQRYRTSWPFRSFRREDAQPLPTGQGVRLRIPLLPIAWRFARGSRIRWSLTGADSTHFSQVPHGAPPLLTIFTSSTNGSSLNLPILGRAASVPKEN